MTEIIDNELSSINNIVQSLIELDEEAKRRVLGYVLKRFNIVLNETTLVKPSDSTLPTNASDTKLNTTTLQQDKVSFTDIRSLKEEKRPKTAIQMAVLVAYYLQEFATPNERKDSVTSEDITKYFKQAGFPLPSGKPIFALTNAKNAGYFEVIGKANFRLNPVGYNLAAYQLPNLNSKTPANKTKRSNVQKKSKK